MSRASIFLIFLILLSSGSTIIMDEASGQPEIISIAITPPDPTVEDDLNISVTIDPGGEEITRVFTHYCHIRTEQCYTPLDLYDDGSGTTYANTYPHDRDPFAWGVANFTIEVEYEGGLKNEVENIFINFRDVPHGLNLTAEADRTTLFPNQTVTVDGHLEYDIGMVPETGSVALHIEGTSQTNSTNIDDNGDFTLGMAFAEGGSYTLNLSTSAGGFQSCMDWPITVNRWPVPTISIDGSVTWDPLEAPPDGGGEVFYVNSTVTADYWVTNSGTGDAINATVNITIENGTTGKQVDAGILGLDSNFTDRFRLDTAEQGNYRVLVNVTWDQESPGTPGSIRPSWSFSYSVVEEPTWEPHSVLVELFTSTTCRYCVGAEEAIERLYRERMHDFEFISYIIDDEASRELMEHKDVTATPVVFIDGSFFRLGDSGETELEVLELMDTFGSRIEEAARRNTPPSTIEIMEKDGTLVIELSLSAVATEDISGTLKVFELEVYPSIRNYQSIPMSHRYQEVASNNIIATLAPGETREVTTLDHPDNGAGYVAVLYADEGEDAGKVLQTASYIKAIEPELYSERASKVIHTRSPSTVEFDVTIDKFSFMELQEFDHEYLLGVSDLPDGWSVLGPGSLPLKEEMSGFPFSSDNAVLEVKNCGRKRYHSTANLTIEVPKEANGTFTLNIIVGAGERTVRNSVVVMTTPSDRPDDGDVNLTIDRVWLESENRKSLHIYAEIHGLPDRSVVKAKILPCNEDGGYCGQPVILTLARDFGDIFKASVLGVDFSNFTHLSYEVYVEHDGKDIIRSGEGKLELSTLIDIETGNGAEDGGDSLNILIISVAILVLVFASIVLIFILLNRREGKEERAEGTADTNGPGTEPATESGAGEGDNILTSQESPPEEPIPPSVFDRAVEKKTEGHIASPPKRKMETTGTAISGDKDQGDNTGSITDEPDPPDGSAEKATPEPSGESVV